MIAIRNAFKRAYHAALRLAWLLGGQKEHGSSGLLIPAGGFVSEEATLVFPENMTLGENILLSAGARLICAGMPPFLAPAGQIKIGEGAVIREGVILQTYGGSITVGKNCTVNPYCLIQGNGGVEIGDNTLIASHVCMYSANHRFADRNRPIRAQGETREGIRVGTDVWIGGGAIILDGVTIGDGAVIAAGAVVNRDIASGSIVAGVPGRQVGFRGEG
jgi:acetyltransferase-like isoleucine patch superfamily enzyme